MKRIIIILLAVLVVGAVTLDAKKPRKKSRATATTINLYEQDFSGIFYIENVSTNTGAGRVVSRELFAIWTDYDRDEYGDKGITYRGNAGAQQTWVINRQHSLNGPAVRSYGGAITGENTFDLFYKKSANEEETLTVEILSKNRIKINGKTYKRLADYQDLYDYLQIKRPPLRNDRPHYSSPHDGNGDL